MNEMRKYGRAFILALAAVSLGLAGRAADADFNRGVKLYNQRDFKNANICFEQAVRSNPKNPTALYYKALSAQQSGDMTQALQCYSSLCDTFPGTEEARNAARVIASSKRGAQASQNSKASGAASMVVTTPANHSIFEHSNVGAEELATLPEESTVGFTRGPQGHLFVTAFINNCPMQVMFDTGASTCLFGRNQFLSAGVKGQATGEKVPVQGVGNSVQSAQEEIVTIRVGGITRTMPVTVSPQLSLAPLLGETFYNGYACDIDNQAGIIRFVKKTSSRRFNSMTLDTIDVPYQLVGNNLVVHAKVNGAECPMFFDTGASGVVFSISQAMSIGLRIPSSARAVMRGGVGGTAPGYEFEVDELELGAIKKYHVPVDVLISGGPPLPLLGQPFLRDRRFTIDYDRHLIKFSR